MTLAPRGIDATVTNSVLASVKDWTLCVLVTHGFGGGTTWAFRLRDVLSQIGVRTRVISQGDGTRLPEQPDFAYRRSQHLAAYLRKEAPAVVFSNWVWSALGVARLLRQRGVELRTIAHCRSDSDDAYFRPLSANRDAIDAVIAVSRRLEQKLRLQLPPELAAKVEVVPTFVEVAAPSARSRAGDETIRCVAAGRLVDEYKRFGDIRGFVAALLGDACDFTLTIAGSGPLLADLVDDLATLRHQGRVRFVGPLHYSEMPSLFRDSDVFVQFSGVEGLSSSMIEAMANGAVPVVAHASSGVDEVIVDRVNGFVRPVGRPELLAGVVTSLAAARTELVRLSDAAASTAASYSVESHLLRLARVVHLATASARTA